jgi:hypothetical protein
MPADQHRPFGPDLGRLARRRAAVPPPVELHQHNDVIVGLHDRLVALRDGLPVPPGALADQHPGQLA